MQSSGDSIHPCRSLTPTVNGHDLTLPTRTQTSEQEYSDLTASNRRPSTSYSLNTPQSVSQGTRSYAFSRSTKHVKTFLAYSQDLSKCCRRVKRGRQSYGRDETALRIIQLWFNYFVASFFKTLGKEMLIIWKFPKSIAGRTKGPRVPHAARGPRVWDPWLR